MTKGHHGRSKVSLYRAVIIATLALSLTAISFHGALDGFAQGQVAKTSNETIGIYVVSRAINSLISVLQTSQINVPFLGSSQVGEILDPVNDAVERLSSIVVWAVGSLLLQRILLEVATSLVFKWALGVTALATIGMLLLLEWERFRVLCGEILGVSDTSLERGRDRLVGVFVAAAILRFIVPILIGVSFLVSQMFLDTEIAKGQEQLSSLRSQVSNIASSPSSVGEDFEEQKTSEEARLKGLESSKAALQREMEQLDARISQLKEGAGWRASIPKLLGGDVPSEELVSARERQREFGHELERIEREIAESEHSLKCIETRIVGGSCDSLWDRIAGAGKAGILKLRETFAKLNDMATEITMLLVAVAIKNILFPILFLMGAVKCSLPLARHASRLLCGFERDRMKLTDSVRNHLDGSRRALEGPDA